MKASWSVVRGAVVLVGGLAQSSGRSAAIQSDWAEAAAALGLELSVTPGFNNRPVMIGDLRRHEVHVSVLSISEH